MDKKIERDQTYYQKNRDKILNRSKEYCQKNKEAIREKAKHKYREFLMLIKKL